MKKQTFPKEFIDLLHSIKNKRARVVIDHILKKGFITTGELEEKYGYNHPPRAARDVREAGIPLETFRVKDKNSKSIAAYKFGDLNKVQKNRLSGRTVLSKEFKKSLYQLHKGKCFICSGRFESRYLQTDHRIPYELQVMSHQSKRILMALCCFVARVIERNHGHANIGSIGKKKKILPFAKNVIGGSPENYLHIALRSIRRLDIHWEEHEIKSYDRIKALADREKTSLPDFVKKVLDKSSSIK
jgi:hypothetical protein